MTHQYMPAKIVGTFCIWIIAAVILAFGNISLAVVVAPSACFLTVLLWAWGRARPVTGEKPDTQHHGGD